MSDPKKLTVGQFFRKLKLGQVWALLGIVAGLLAGAFSLGYKVSSMVTDPKLAEKDVQIASARQEAEQKTAELNAAKVEIGDLGTKERFLSLYLRYLIARNSGDTAERDSTRKAFDEFIRQFVDAKELIIRKGGKRLATIKFNDGTSWELPPELHMVEER